MHIVILGSSPNISTLIVYYIKNIVTFFEKAWEAQLAEHGFEATGAVSSSLTSSKYWIYLTKID